MFLSARVRDVDEVDEGAAGGSEDAAAVVPVRAERRWRWLIVREGWLGVEVREAALPCSLLLWRREFGTSELRRSLTLPKLAVSKAIARKCVPVPLRAVLCSSLLSALVFLLAVLVPKLLLGGFREK